MIIDLLDNIIENFWHFFTMSAPWLLLGFGLAGILKEVMPQSWLLRLIGRHKISGVITAAVIGLPLPICSCGVIPTAMALHQQGASRGATVSFLIATPAISVTAIILSSALLGWQFTAIYMATALIVAISTGLLVLYLCHKEDAADNKKRAEVTQKQSEQMSVSWRHKIKRAFYYGYVEMLGKVSGWILLGLLISSVIGAVVPENIIADLLGGNIVTFIMMALAAIPVYICSTAAVPMMAALVASGAAPVGALIFLILGPAINIATVMVTRKEIGGKATLIYMSGLLFMTIICATIFHILGLI